MNKLPKNEEQGTFGVIFLAGGSGHLYVPEREYHRIRDALWASTGVGPVPDPIIGFADLYGASLSFRLSEIAGCYLNTPSYRLELSAGRLANREAWEEVELYTGELLPDWADS